MKLNKLMVSFIVLFSFIYLIGCSSSSDDKSNEGLKDSLTGELSNLAAAESAHGLNLSLAEQEGTYGFANARITVTLQNATTNNGGVVMTWGPHSWTSSDGYSDGVACVAWKDGETWKAGYFDYKGIAQGNWATGHSYSGSQLYNVYNGYNANINSGDEVGFFILSLDGTERSNVVFATWPINK